MNELARIEAVVFLQSVDIFSFCRAEEVLRIAAIASERLLEDGETIYDVNDPAETLYCVVRGGVRLRAGDGTEHRAGPLDTFGVTEILSGRLREATAVAEADTLVLAIDAEDLFDLLAHDIEIVKALFRHLIQRLRADNGDRARA